MKNLTLLLKPRSSDVQLFVVQISLQPIKSDQLPGDRYMYGWNFSSGSLFKIETEWKPITTGTTLTSNRISNTTIKPTTTGRCWRNRPNASVLSPIVADQSFSGLTPKFRSTTILARRRTTIRKLTTFTRGYELREIGDVASCECCDQVWPEYRTSDGQIGSFEFVHLKYSFL